MSGPGDGDGGPTPYGSGIFPQHAELLTGSGLSGDVVKARGYVSADQKRQLARFGFSGTQQLVPALVIPMWDVTGGRGGYQARPDQPRMSAKTGRVVKYETPGGDVARLDVHPHALTRLRNPQVPLFITEGVRKGDAMVTQGLCAVALTGVWNWRGRNEDEGLTALADWESIALNDRRVYVVFDSDVVTKSAVHEAMRRLKAFLERRGAHVFVIYLPAEGDGTKVGADDYLLGHSTDEMIGLAEEKLRRAPEDNDEDAQAEALALLLERIPEEPGHRLLDDLAAFIDRYVAFPVHHHASVVALWVLHTHAHLAFDSTPRLAVTSPEKRSGKTRVLEVIEPLVHVPIRTESITSAALYRLVEDRAPTLLIDEVDTIFGPMAANHEDLRALLNSGHRKGAVTYRCVGDGGNMTVAGFKTYAPVALAGIGSLPDTVADRSIHIRMRRRAPGEQVASFRFKDVEADAVDLRERALAWVTRHAEHLVEARADLPEGVTDRAADVWEPLLILADRAGGRWPQSAREANVALNAESAEGQSPASGPNLLADIASIFAEPDIGKWISNVELVRRLKEIDESPWDDLHPPLTKFVLAKKLKAYGIASKRFRHHHDRVRAYYRDDFTEAWSRYTTPAPPSGADLSGTLGTTARNGGETRPDHRPEGSDCPGTTRDSGPVSHESVPRPELSQIQEVPRDPPHPPDKATVPSVPDKSGFRGRAARATPLPVTFMGGTNPLRDGAEAEGPVSNGGPPSSSTSGNGARDD